MMDPTSLHKYVFANNNPVMNYDPSGHMTLNQVMITVAVVGILHGIAAPLFSWNRWETDFAGIPDAGVIGGGVNASWMQATYVAGAEAVFSIASSQFAAFTYHGPGVAPSVQLGPKPTYLTAARYSALVWNMWNVDEYSGNFTTFGGSARGWSGSAFTGDDVGAPWGLSVGRVTGDPGLGFSLTYTYYTLRQKINYPSMSYAILLGATWGLATALEFGASANGLLYLPAGASFWPYAKWKGPEKLLKRQTEDRWGSPP